MLKVLLLLVFARLFLINEAFRVNKELATMECKAKFNVPFSDIDNIKNRQMPESKEGKCMMACILKKLKVINREGKFQVNTVKGWINDKYKGDATKLKRAYARADACAEQLPTLGEDECEYAVKILECSKYRKKKDEKQLKTNNQETKREYSQLTKQGSLNNLNVHAKMSKE